MPHKPTFRKTYPASNLEMKRGTWERGGIQANGRYLETDTHCTTEGYPGSFKPLDIPSRKPRHGAAITAALAAAALLFTFMMCYLAGCIS